MVGRPLVAAAGAALMLLSTSAAEAQLFGARLTGTIEEDVSWIRRTRSTGASETLTLGSRYAPSVDGWVLDPRLFTITYSGSLVDQTTTGEQSARALQIEPYRLLMTAFPFGLHTFTAQASRSTTDFDFEAGTSAVGRDAWGLGWAYRGGPRTPESSLAFTRETTDETFLEGTTEERTRTRVSLRLHKDLERFRPTLNYSFEVLETDSARPTFEEDGIRHHVLADDRIRVGEGAVLTPVLEFRAAPEGRDANATATLTAPVSPSVDTSGSVRYSFFERENVVNHTAAAQGQFIKRFTEDYLLTTGANGVFVTGGAGGDAWSGGGLAAFRIVPFRTLQGVADYGLQLSQTATTSTVSHRGHVNAVSTLVPRHTLTADYFFSATDIEQNTGTTQLEGRTFSVLFESRLLPGATLSSGYTLDIQESSGHRRRHSGRFAADVAPAVGVTSRAGVEAYTEEETGGGRERRVEDAILASASVTVRPTYWVELGAAGRYGVRDLEREERPGRFTSSAVSGLVGLNLRALFARAEGFLERDEDFDDERVGLRGNFSYRFRAWTITADFEFLSQTIQGLDVGLQRAGIRVSRPLSFGFR